MAADKNPPGDPRHETHQNSGERPGETVEKDGAAVPRTSEENEAFSKGEKERREKSPNPGHPV